MTDQQSATICEDCGEDRALTYRNKVRDKRSVCADCVRKNYPAPSGIGWQIWVEE